jgi:hypothetical protein
MNHWNSFAILLFTPLLMLLLLTFIFLKATESVTATRKVSFQQQEVTVKTASSLEMSSATTRIQETQAQEQSETMQQGLETSCILQSLTISGSELAQALEVKEGDAFYALATFVSETGEAMNLVEGERVYVLEWNNADWWYVRKHLTEETGWVPAQYLKDEETYTMYVQRKLVEKIEKLPVFESKFHDTSVWILSSYFIIQNPKEMKRHLHPKSPRRLNLSVPPMEHKLSLFAKLRDILDHRSPGLDKQQSSNHHQTSKSIMTITTWPPL